MATEKRLIDANDACESLCNKCGLDRGECERIGFCADYMDIKRLPTVDAVEVVRCKNCQHWDEDTGFCDVNSHFYEFGMYWDIFEEDDYCSYGERKVDE